MENRSESNFPFPKKMIPQKLIKKSSMLSVILIAHFFRQMVNMTLQEREKLKEKVNVYVNANVNISVFIYEKWLILNFINDWKKSLKIFKI